KVWNLYKKFDKTLENNNVHSGNYEEICKKSIKNYDELDENKKIFCRKLVRNLGCYNYENENYNPSKEDCTVLYYWIYKSVNQYSINDNLITPIFYDNYSKLCTYQRKANCFYYHYYDYFKDPVKMIFLDIFHHNIDIIRKSLGGADNENSLQKYICKCIHIYKEMYKKYCPYNDDKDKKRKNTCSMLSIVKYTYDTFLREHIYNKQYAIPYIEDVEDYYSEKCIEPESILNKGDNNFKSVKTTFTPRIDTSKNKPNLKSRIEDHKESNVSYLDSRINYDMYKDVILRSKDDIDKIPGIYISRVVRDKLDTLANESNST
ncbi:hypothetical protein PCYB_007470, partial [Plasmodium cynomolgi strain B]